MKKITLFIFACLLSFTVFSQTIVNEEIDKLFTSNQKKEYFTALNKFKKLRDNNASPKAIFQLFDREGVKKNPLLYLVNAEIFKLFDSKLRENAITYNNWGISLLRFSTYIDNFDIYGEEARKAFTLAERMSYQRGAYNLACYYSLIKNTKRVLLWLKFTLEKDYKDKMTKDSVNRLNRDFINNDPDLDFVKNEPEYVAILDKYFPLINE